MTPNRIGGGHGEIPNPMVADALHSMQVGNSLKTLDLTGLEEVLFSQLTRFLTRLEPFCGFIPILSNSKRPKVKFKDKPYLTLEECLSYKPSAIAVRSENIACLDYDYHRGLLYAAKRGIDFTADGWHVRKSSDNWNLDKSGIPQNQLNPSFHRYKTAFLLTDEQAEEIGPCTSAKQDYQGSGIDVFPKAQPYIIVLGFHEHEGFYYSPNGLDVVDLAPPSPEVFELLVEANKSKPATKTKRSSSSCRGEWIAAQPCPVCSRDKDADCRITRSGDAVLCHHGNTFHPPHMRKGEIISGSQWAYCGEGESVIGTHSIFRIHKARRCLKPPTHKYRRQTHAT